LAYGAGENSRTRNAATPHAHNGTPISSAPSIHHQEAVLGWGCNDTEDSYITKGEDAAAVMPCHTLKHLREWNAHKCAATQTARQQNVSPTKKPGISPSRAHLTNRMPEVLGPSWSRVGDSTVHHEKPTQHLSAERLMPGGKKGWVV